MIIYLGEIDNICKEKNLRWLLIPAILSKDYYRLFIFTTLNLNENLAPKFKESLATCRWYVICGQLHRWL